MVDVFSLFKEFGPEIALVCFFVWQSWKRELRTDRRIAKLEDEQKKIILPLVKEATEVISRNTVIMERLELTLRAFDACKGMTDCPLIK